MAGSKAKEQRLEQAHAALRSADDAKVLDAVARIEAEGDARSIPALLHALAAAGSGAVRARITGVLHSVKAAGAAPALLAALDDPALAPVHRTVLAAFWSAGLDARGHLPRFIACALEGDAETGLECLTVIENQEGWPEADMRAALGRVREAAAGDPGSTRSALLQAIAEELERRLGAAH